MLIFLGKYMAGMLVNITGVIAALSALILISYTPAPFEVYTAVCGIIMLCFGSIAGKIITPRPAGIAKVMFLALLSLTAGGIMAAALLNDWGKAPDTTVFCVIGGWSVLWLVCGGILYLCGCRTNRRVMSFLGAGCNLSLAGVLAAAIAACMHIKLF
ncbi:MAG: hypothetical protein IJ184_05675 [Alphaproteobacteria bacterium]|nr:hypothetical protein [Alphaproteobacteria bacterium]